MVIRKRWENTPIPRRCFAVNPLLLRRFHSVANALCVILCVVVCSWLAPMFASAAINSRSSELRSAVGSVRFAVQSRELTSLARALKVEEEARQTDSQSDPKPDADPPPAYTRLARFAKTHAKEELGARAALALGYDDYSNGRYTQARAWLDLAKPEKLLPDYVLFWSAQVDRDLNNNAAALDQLQSLRQNYPQSVMLPLALQAYAETAIALTEPQQALDALASAKDIDENPTLLFLRAQAHEQANDQIAAAGDYLEVYDRFPLSTQADEAGQKVALLKASMGSAFPQPLASDQLLRANILFAAHNWQDAENAYADAVPVLSGSDAELGQLHIAECKVQLGGDASLLVSPQFQTPEVDAERLYDLSQAYRSAKDETSMLATLAQVQSRYPQSSWTERTLFAVGNYYWVKLDRDHAAAEYQQVADKFPSSDDATSAQWRVAWTAYMDRSADAEALIGKFLADHPDSVNTPDVLYWLGRLAEQKRNRPEARAYFRKLQERFPNSYFAMHAFAPLRALGRGRVAALPVLESIPRIPREREVLKSLPSAAFPYVQRSTALETIAFDDSAMLELKAAYDATHSIALQLDLARVATNGEHYDSAMAAIRSIYPLIESRAFASASRQAWVYAFPLPYAAQIRSDARRTGSDPMLIAGLIHQESAFDKSAHSYANAFGLMQLVPGTAAIYARQLRLGFSEDRLLDARYNLRLGSTYFGELMHSFHSAEAALAAYNAGEDRVTLWQTGQKYAELPEFVESIPFSQTREYVEIVMRNAAIYRRLYGGRGAK